MDNEGVRILYFNLFWSDDVVKAKADSDHYFYGG